MSHSYEIANGDESSWGAAERQISKAQDGGRGKSTTVSVKTDKAGNDGTAQAGGDKKRKAGSSALEEAQKEAQGLESGRKGKKAKKER